MDAIDPIARRYASAVHDKDEAAFLSLYHPDAVVFDLWDRWSYRGREEWSGMVRAWFGALGDERVVVGFSPVFSQVHGDQGVWGAIVRYAAVDASGTELRAMENRISWVLRRMPQGEWLIVHEHSSAPVDFASGKVSLRHA